MKDVLNANVSKHIQLSAKELDEFFALTSFKKFSPGEYLLQEGQICRHRFFLLKGLVYTYYLDEKGSEKIVQFGVENWWITDLESFVGETSSKFYIKAIEQTECLMISKANLEKLLEVLPKLERFFRILTENHLMAMQKKYTYYWHLSNKQKYNAFVKALPDFSQRVPQYMIASYLEMTPEYLSEIRKKK